MEKLVNMTCVPCRGGVPTLTDKEIDPFRAQVPEWEVIQIEGVNRLERKYKFMNFRQALAFSNKVGELAEAEDHHPAILIEWGKVTVTWWTHSINGLHQNDFIMAAKTDLMYLE